MKRKPTHQELEEAWARAVERANQDHGRAAELSEAVLNDAAGLRVKSGVKAGWFDTTSCDVTCTCGAGR